MAHENHRFNLLLRNGNHPTAGKKTSLNPIFSEASNGTHYSIFAEFLPKDPDKVYQDEFDVASIRVKLMNYTGAVTMGISSVIGINIYDGSESKKEFIIDQFSTKRVVELVVSVQPLNICNEKTINLNDELLSLKLQEGDLFETKVLHKLIDESYSGARRGRLGSNNLILDENYMRRDGEEIVLQDGIWDHRTTIEMLETAGFVINDQINDTLKSNDAAMNKYLEADKTKKLMEASITGNKSRRDDPKCKQKTSDIYIV
ncbi:hypothetical protein G5B37_13615 [Rasiella rasia]|uniref:Uncharacterized protein n=1 Tax=Rasiella rasia TaxID=2744027 RepID=A0A6G6GPN8_9FLAO|nr:hypothetical protein [Rasiella rasia]QIE60565.1 hypothetical protein G5B37_13615 [Rasiella rasia]